MLPYTLVFYEAPHRISDMLADGLEVLGNRKICLARELTKKHEEFIRGSISEVLEVCEGLKGEMVVVIEGAKKEDLKSSMEEAMNLMKEQIANGKAKGCCQSSHEMTKIGRNELYSAYLELNQE